MRCLNKIDLIDTQVTLIANETQTLVKFLIEVKIRNYMYIIAYVIWSAILQKKFAFRCALV